MAGEIPSSHLETEFPQHWEVIRRHAEPIRQLSLLENQRYSRTSKPPEMQIQFLVNTDITTATYAGESLDIRTRQGLIYKPSEVLEAAQALTNYYALADAASNASELDVDFTHAFQDTAAEAVVEVSDVIYNSFQMFLTTAQYGDRLMTACIQNLNPESLDVLLRVAEDKYAVRYQENGTKNIPAENKKIRDLLIESELDPIFKVLNSNRKNFADLLATVLSQGRDIAAELEVLYDDHGNDKALKDYHLNAFLQFRPRKARRRHILF